MSLLEFFPKSFFSMRRFRIVRDGVPVGEIDGGRMREQATITIGGATYAAAREGLMSGAYYLEAGGKRLASAERPSVFSRRFTLQTGAKTYSFGAASAFGRSFALTENGVDVGTIARESFFSRRSMAKLPDDLGLEVKAFLIWLVILMWQRQVLVAGVVGGTAAGGR